ncbi:N-acetyltransferase [Luteitalea sp. TBR-22]|uniref:GNAT family N-acetyltransferase n=1 Tax=Luteitalea sp. TBR-22 TaxID=2802971 RepID=UPI001AF9E465|nr:GNAT family N-acetyltransferase [Luteitalea sp. TBR-22]BCS34416.1 N-acetyltransferase [Luteitalea sp. TBR-22]
MPIRWTHTIDDIDWHELEALYRAAPLGNKNADDLRVAYANSRYRCFAWEDGRLVGAGRALADGVDCSYVCDVAVLPSHQGTGVGKAIVQQLVDLSRGHRKIILYAVPGKEAFYRRFGFLRMRTAMAIFPDQAKAIADGYVSED